MNTAEFYKIISTSPLFQVKELDKNNAPFSFINLTNGQSLHFQTNGIMSSTLNLEANPEIHIKHGGQIGDYQFITLEEEGRAKYGKYISALAQNLQLDLVIPRKAARPK